MVKIFASFLSLSIAAVKLLALAMGSVRSSYITKVHVLQLFEIICKINLLTRNFNCGIVKFVLFSCPNQKTSYYQTQHTNNQVEEKNHTSLIHLERLVHLFYNRHNSPARRVIAETWHELTRDAVRSPF